MDNLQLHADMKRAAPTANLQQRILDLLNIVTYRHIHTEAERDEVYRLRYDAYLREGSIEPNSTGRLTDAHDDTENGTTFGVYIGSNLAGSIRLHSLERGYTSPAFEIFPDFLEPLVASGARIIDPTRFVADATLKRQYPELPYLTMRLPYLAAIHYNAQWITATVRKEHQAFYRRILPFKPVGEPRFYPTLMKPHSLMLGDVLKEPITARHPFFEPQPGELDFLFKPLNRPGVDDHGDHHGLRRSPAQKLNDERFLGSSHDPRLDAGGILQARCIPKPESPRL